jgi:hypothetical protein
MSPERQIDESELMDVADDPEQARRLHKALRTINDADSLDPALREMARKVLRGDIGMQDAIETEKYTQAIYSRLHTMKKAADDQTYAERQAVKGQFVAWQEKRAEEAAREQAERDAPKHLRTPAGPRPGGPSHR